ncbi:MAG: hypothetical protein U5Q44_00035 [Dehalococcoidia bacterium]|nr:hypothetical protein [Dehalococcoidia bacterium]
MAELRAEPLSPLDAATLWPQLRRLGTEVVATRARDHAMRRAGLAATGFGQLPKLPRLSVAGVRRGLAYQGVLVARQLSQGSAWEIVSLRIAREKDDETITLLLDTAAGEAANRGGRQLFMRYAEGSPHERAMHGGGLDGFTREHLYAPLAGGPGDTSQAGAFRLAERADRHDIFRLYCRAVPEAVRRHEAVTQQEFRAVLDAFGCDEEYVLDSEGTLAAWVGVSDQEARILDAGWHPEAGDIALQVAGMHLGTSGVLVLGEYQEREHERALAHGYAELGTRVVAARRLAALNPLKEALAVPVTSRVPN